MKMKPLPWMCSHCRERAVQLVMLPYSTEISHDGRTYTVNIPDLQVGRCERCGNTVLPHAASQRITETFRQQRGFLKPEEIRQERKRLGLTQKELASLIGSADATLSRLETGTQMQSRLMDNSLRLFFALPEVRDLLRQLNEDPHSGTAAELATGTEASVSG